MRNALRRYASIFWKGSSCVAGSMKTHRRTDTITSHGPRHRMMRGSARRGGKNTSMTEETNTAVSSTPVSGRRAASRAESSYQGPTSQARAGTLGAPAA